MRHRFWLLPVLILAGCAPPDENRDQMSRGCAPWSDGFMIGTTRSDELLDVLVDDGGNVYAAGYEDGITGETNIEPSGNAVGILLKYGPGGELLARHVIDTDGADTIEAMALHPHSRELHFVGRTNGALPGFATKGQFDILVGWLDAGEAAPTAVQFGTERAEHPRRLAIGRTGELVIGGYDDVFVPTNYVETWENPLHRQYTRVGDAVVEVWHRTFDTTSPDVFGGLALGADGASYVTGNVASGPDRGMFVAKVDSQGTELWYRQQTGLGYDMGAALEMLPDGNVLLAGSTFELLGEVAFGQQDVVVRKIDAETGEAIWTVQYGSTETDWVTDMAVDKHGQIYLVGETWGAVEPGSANRGGVDVFLIKLDARGKLMAARQWGSPAGDYPTAVAVDGCEQAFIVGYTTGELVGPLSGGRDGFVIPVDTSSRQGVP